MVSKTDWSDFLFGIIGLVVGMIVGFNICGKVEKEYLKIKTVEVVKNKQLIVSFNPATRVMGSFIFGNGSIETAVRYNYYIPGSHTGGKSPRHLDCEESQVEVFDTLEASSDVGFLCEVYAYQVYDFDPKSLDSRFWYYTLSSKEEVMAKVGKKVDELSEDQFVGYQFFIPYGSSFSFKP